MATPADAGDDPLSFADLALDDGGGGDGGVATAPVFADAPAPAPVMTDAQPPPDEPPPPYESVVGEAAGAGPSSSVVRVFEAGCFCGGTRGMMAGARATRTEKRRHQNFLRALPSF